MGYNFLNQKKFDLKNVDMNSQRENMMDSFQNVGMQVELEELFEFLKKYSNRMDKYADRYFGFGNRRKEKKSEELHNYLETVRRFRTNLEWIMKSHDVNNGEFIEYCAAMEDVVIDAFDDDLSDEQYEILIQELGYYFMYSLAYYMYQHPDKKVRDEFSNDFLEIMNSDELCKEQYLKFTSTIFNPAPYVEPDAKYCCPIIMAVLSVLDNKSVQRKVKKVIYKYTKNDYRKLAEVNKKEYDLFMDYDILVDRDIYMREFAFTFIMDYLEDRLFLAPFCAFTRVMEAELDTLMFENTLLKRRVTSSTLLEEYEPALKDTVEKIKNSDEKSIRKAVDDVHLAFVDVFLIKSKSSYPIEGNGARSKILDAHYSDILEACVMSKLMSGEGVKDFLEMNDIEKIRFVLIQAYAFYFMGKLKDSEDYVNKTVDVDSAKILTEKVNEILAREETIAQLKEEIKKKDEGVKELKKAHKDEINSTIEKTRKSFKKDISELKKEIDKKDEQIRELLEEREEFYKLRELMFALENEDEFVEVPQKESLAKLSEKLNIVFVGGHEHLQKYMKNSFPKIIYLIGDSESFDDRLIASADYVFFCYKHMNHGVYQKVMKTITAERIKFDYVSTTNVKRLENEIVSKIELGGKTRKN